MYKKNLLLIIVLLSVQICIGQQLVRKTTHLWTLNFWDDYLKDTLIYDSSGNLIEDLILRLDTNNNMWINDATTQYTYDLNNNRTGGLFMRWNLSQSNWENWSRYSWTYDLNNHLTDYFSERWQFGSWVNSLKIKYNTNINGKFINHVADYWNSSNMWIKIDSTTYAYNTNGLILEILGRNWVNSLNNWVYAEKESFNYGANDSLSRKLHEQWENGNWTIDRDWNYVYDSNDYLIHSYGDYWVDSVNTWFPWFTTDFVNYANGKVDTAFHNFLFVSTNLFDTFSVTDYDYVNFSSVNNVTYNLENLFLFPNPVDDILYFDSELKSGQTKILEIYSLKGELVYKRKNASNSINISDIPSGIYSLKIILSDKLYTTKFIKN